MIFTRSRCLIASMLLFALDLTAQSQPWSNVKALSPGTEIRIRGPHPSAVRGTLLSVTDESLVLNSSAGQEMFTPQQVNRVSIKKQGHRARNALIGLGVGAGTGLVVGAVDDQHCAPNCFLGKNLSKTVFTPLGAILGILIGAVIPTGGWRDVYKQ